MAHPNHHAESSARKFGGVPADYHALHDWFDASKAHEALPVHRALRHHSLGIFEAQRTFGRTLFNSDGREVPVRFVAEQHVREDCRRIPSVSDWLRGIPVATWMVNGVILPDTEPVAPDKQADWRASVAAGQTILGFEDWLADRETREKAASARTGQARFATIESPDATLPNSARCDPSIASIGTIGVQDCEIDAPRDS